MPNHGILLSLPGRPVSHDIGIETHVAAPYKPIIDRVIELICEFWREPSADGIRQAELYWTVNHYELGSAAKRSATLGASGHSAVGLVVKGIVNGTRIDEELAATRSLGRKGGSSEQMVQSCLDECMAGGLSAINQAAGIAESGFAKRWRLVVLVTWIATVGMLAGFLAVTLPQMQPAGKHIIEIRNPDGRRNFMIFAAVLAAVGVFFSAFMTAVATAPSRFLSADPRGIRLMARLGMRSVTATRVVAALIAMTGPVLIGGAIYIYRHPMEFQ